MKPKQDEVVRPLSREVAQRLVDEAQTRLDRIVFKIVLNSGIQMDELLGIRISDIDFMLGEIRIAQPGKVPRKIKFSSSLMADIKAYIGPDQPDGYLINIKRDALFKRLGNYKNITDFDWRVLRRTYGTLALAAGGDPVMIANNIGITLEELQPAISIHGKHGLAPVEVVK
ncbi:MAG: tyrosine-type recombinase/integrase [Candidatus Micrarchaeota archaeon]|nr:tyrosine-type recombinase/integrase [Candidatus Micrarchaeota archaeon]